MKRLLLLIGLAVLVASLVLPSAGAQQRACSADRLVRMAPEVGRTINPHGLELWVRYRCGKRSPAFG